MKLTSYSFLAALFACGMANAAYTAYTTPVGYEQLPLASGYNFLGLRLQQSPVASGTITAVSSSSVTVGTLDVGALLTGGKTYILEVANASGVTQEFLGSSATGSVITTPDLSAKITVGDKYTIRPAATLASIFGAANEAGLDTGFFGPGGDTIMLPNPATEGGFDQYYYDSGYSSYADINGNTVDGAAIAVNYSDAVLVYSTGVGATALTVSGEIKKANTGYSLVGNSFNFVSSVYPAGATLASSFNAAVPNLDQGFFGPGGDIFYVPNANTEGGFDQYYYDSGFGSWADITGTTVDATLIPLTSGILIYNEGGDADVINQPPTTYSTL